MFEYIKRNEPIIWGVFLPPIFAKIIGVAILVGYDKWAEQIALETNKYKSIGFFVNLIIVWCFAYLLNFKHPKVMKYHKNNIAVMAFIAFACTFAVPLVYNLARALPSKLLSIEPAAAASSGGGFAPVNCKVETTTLNDYTANTPFWQFYYAMTQGYNKDLYKYAVYINCSDCEQKINEACKAMFLVPDIKTPPVYFSESNRVAFIFKEKEQAVDAYNKLVKYDNYHISQLIYMQ